MAHITITHANGHNYLSTTTANYEQQNETMIIVKRFIQL